MQAQYFRDPSKLETYLQANHFLPIINNELPELRNQTYADNFSSLSYLVLALFTEDKTVVPKESSWFGSFSTPEGDAEQTIVPMKEQPLYAEDWIGLKKLDEAGRVKLVACEGQHMELRRTCWEPIVRKYVGGSKNLVSSPESGHGQRTPPLLVQDS